MKNLQKVILAWVMVTLSLFALDNQSSNTKEQYQKALQTASINMYKAMQVGPKEIQLNTLATLSLPEQFGFIPAHEAKEVLALFGHKNLEGTLGMVLANPAVDSESRWMVLISYTDSGHIMDDDAKNWKSDDLLDNLRKGTEEGNVIRKERGFPTLSILGWIEKPHYDEQSNRLLWSIKTLSQGATLDNASINYNTLALSKEGYISMNLVSNLNRIEQEKVVPKTLLSSLHFSEGNQYVDFNAKTDKVAEYGLAALITGIAAKKLGLFALAAGVLLKFSKVILISLAGVGYYFSRRKKTAQKNKDDKENNEA